MDKKWIKKIDNVTWEIPKGYKPFMQVPARFFAEEEMISNIMGDRSLEQLVNVTALPGIVKWSLAMPDIHEGYGFPIGGVAATKFPDGAISPGGIGYDINCGVRLLKSSLHFEDAEEQLERLSKVMYNNIPSGVGVGGQIALKTSMLDEVLREGAGWAVSHGFGYLEDLQMIESNGCLEGADPRCVSLFAKKRGHDQLGTIGAGNHFVEVDRVDEIFDIPTAMAFGLTKGQIVVLIHTGSRGLGHQIATDHLRQMVGAMEKYQINVPDRELACVPFESEEGKNYYGAMLCAANFAWANREVITWEVRKAWSEVFGEKAGQLSLLYDVAHNIAKLETHIVDDMPMKLVVHRKGATRAFGPGSEELPLAYRHTGQPVLIPGSMGTNSYVLAGGVKSMSISFGSCCHGAGRRLSRREAKRIVDAPQLRKKLMSRGVFVQAGSYRGIAEEAPVAYKDVDLVVETVCKAGIAIKVAKLTPLAVVKG